jgi:hypothetical protein
MKTLRFLSCLLWALSLGACSTHPTSATPAATAKQTPQDPGQIRSMLWVGNSFFYYNNSMHGHVGQLLMAQSDNAKRNVRNVSATISGSGINWHDMEAYFKPGGVSSYSFVGDNEVRFNTFDKPFDAVMMMDCSQCPIHPKLRPVFHEFAKKHSATVRKHGAEPVLFMSWAYSDKPEMTGPLAAEYTQVGQANNALVVPAGLAFANSLATRSDIPLIIGDKRHPTLQGTYLGACSVLASVFKVNPVGNAYTAGLPADVAAHLQAVAWATAQKYHAENGRGSL